jgi:2-polyprenyl-3-methyl-5-hydroxy-6-metoxy-1,4-benzoquinol methylase
MFMPTDTATHPEPDPDAVALFAFSVWNYKQGELVSTMIHIGQRLGLYEQLDGAGPTTADQLAERTGLHERWLREWLEGQAAAGLLDHRGDAGFEMSAVASAVMADAENSLAYAAGAFTGPPTSGEMLDQIVNAFRTGIGPTWDAKGATGAHQTEQMLGPWTRLALIPTVLPALDDVVAKLTKGATVADIGCGSGIALIALAAQYPKSTFHGFDSSFHAIDRAQQNLADAGDPPVTFHHADGAALPTTPTYDLVITLDCLHDMTHPGDVASAIRRAIKPDGTWLIKDIRCADRFEENQANPMLAMMYGFSITGCLASSSSAADGAALGTLGLPPSAIEELSKGAGFTRFTPHDFEEPANLYYEVRP